MMKWFKNFTIATLIMALLVTPALGAEGSKSSDFHAPTRPHSLNYSIYYPSDGYIIGYYDSTSTGISTRVSFTYTATAVNNIKNYNNAGRYTGVDVKDLGNCFSAYSVTSTAPDVKTDIEPNAGFDYYNESEIVIFGNLTAGKRYDMNVFWHDYRGGLKSSEFVVNAELSEKGLIDYNVVPEGYDRLAELAYGKTAGYP